jgi:hypothetical protein
MICVAGDDRVRGPAASGLLDECLQALADCIRARFHDALGA